MLYAEFPYSSARNMICPFLSVFGSIYLAITTTVDQIQYSSACRGSVFRKAGCTQAEGVRRRLSSWCSSPLVVPSGACSLRNIAFVADGASFRIGASSTVRRTLTGIVSPDLSLTGLGWTWCAFPLCYHALLTFCLGG